MSNFSLVAAENDFLLNHPNFSIRRPALYPSESSVKYTENGFTFVQGKCHRAAYYRIKGIPKNRQSSLSLIMKGIAGKALEEAAIDRWKCMGIWVGNNIKFFIPNYIISGELDVIIKDPITEQLILEELKSWDGHYAAKMILGSKKPYITGQPRPQHYLQGITYHWEYKEYIPETRLYYADRAGGARVEFRIGTELINGRNVCWRENIPCKYWNATTEKRIYYPFAIEDIHDRFKQLAKYIKTDTLPPKDYGIIEPDKIEYMYSKGDLAKKDYEPWKKNPNKNPIIDYMCNYCDWQGKCKADSIEEENE